MKFTQLVNSIQHTHNALQQEAVKAVNRSLTVRNWLIGFYIVEFEQRGEDRAKYGEKLLKELAKAIAIRGLSETGLRLNRLFYRIYPQIRQTVSDELVRLQIHQTLSDILEINSAPNITIQIRGTQSPKSDTAEKDSAIVETASEQFIVPSDKILNRLSFSHITELLPIQDPLKRAFYEIECMKGVWGVRELKRQINSLYYERSGLSTNPQKLSAMVAEKAEPLQPADIIKSVYTFEFLGLQAKDVVEESDLETALLDHLQQFMLELGRGYCFEARQQKILIGHEYEFVDMVFYNRILKCHVLIDFKMEAFSHNNAGQLNTYLNYYKNEVMEPDDNPPVGILMVTDRNKALVEYATAGIDNALFVSKYLVQLPSKEQLLQFVQNELKNL
jgi:predicted nuclease of restriction endonuclease-like (RecB) superfamily